MYQSQNSSWFDPKRLMNKVSTGFAGFFAEQPAATKGILLADDSILYHMLI
jgi:hypothetical protein